ncbi:MAG: hypothetical protein Q4D40_06855 [Eubacteriales bacterium]|nr:hypothetical protein [Eubacteriales bacterium]
MEELEREIDIVDLLFFILRRWRSVLAAAIAGMIILGGVKAAVSIQSDKKEPLKNEVIEYTETEKRLGEKNKALHEKQRRLNELENSITNQQISIERLKRDLDRAEKYNNESLLMEINPYEKPQIIKNYRIRLNNADPEAIQELYRDPADEILSAYIVDGLNYIDFEQIADKYDTTEYYIRELVSIGGDWNANLLQLKAVGTDMQMAEELLQLIDSSVSGRKQEITEKYQNHNLETVLFNKKHVIDMELVDIQNGKWDSIVNLQTDLDNKYSALELAGSDAEDTRFEISSINSEIHKLMEQIGEEAGKSLRLKGIIKYGIIGCFGAAFLLCGLYCVCYLLEDKLRTSSDIRQTELLQVLGVMADRTERDKRFIIDRWIKSLKPKESVLDDATSLRMIAVGLESRISEGGRLFVAGNAEKHVMSECIRCLREIMPDIGIIQESSFGISPDTLRDISERDSVILLEQRNVSKMKDISSRTELLESNKKNVLGVVIY